MGISRDKDNDGNRWYENGDTEALSVTTILGFLDEDTTGLEYWKDKNDGRGDSAYWQHLFWYSRHRGTLCHYQALKQFEDCFDGGDMWGEEEQYSMSHILKGPEENWSDEPDDWSDVPECTKEIAYSVLKRQERVYDRAEFDHMETVPDLIDVCLEDLEWFSEQFEQICDDLCIDSGSVRAVERFLLEEEYGFGGQTDLLYEASDGAMVVVDLKTSSSLRQKDRLQTVAYAKAVEKADWGPEAVDRVEVIRITPDKREYQVHSHEVPEHAEDLDYYTSEHWFEDYYGDFEYDSLDEMWEKFCELTEKAYKQV